MIRVRAYQLTFASDLELPGLPAAADSAPVDVAIRLAGEEAGAWAAGGTRWEARPGEARLVLEGVAAYRVQDGRSITVAPVPGADPADVRLFLLGSALGALLYQRGLLPLHGSAVATPWGAMVFAGPSGAGKSTLAAHLRKAGFPLLSDDVCALSRRPDGRLQVLPAFPRLRLRPDAAGRLYGPGAAARADRDKVVVDLAADLDATPVVLGAVHHLEDDAAGPALRKVEGFEAIQRLSDNLYRPAFLGAEPRPGGVLRLAAALGATAPVFVLGRPRDAARLDTLVEWLEDQWRRLPAAPSPDP